MRSIVVVAACLASLGLARRVQTPKIQQQGKHVARENGDEPGLKTLATLVLGFSPRSAYTVSPMRGRQDYLEDRRGYGSQYRNIPGYGGRYRNSFYDNYESPSLHRNSQWGIPDSHLRNGYDYSSPYRRGYGVYDDYDSPSQYRNRRLGSYDSPYRNGYDYSSPYRRGYSGHYGNSLYNDYDSPSQYRNRRGGSYGSNGYDYSSPYRRGYGGHYRDSLYDSYDSPYRRGYGGHYRNRFGTGHSSHQLLHRGYGSRSRDNFWEGGDSAQVDNRWGSGSVKQEGGNWLDMRSPQHRRYFSDSRDYPTYGGGRWPRSNYYEMTPDSVDNAWKY